MSTLNYYCLPHFFSNWATSALSIEIYKREHREAVADYSLKSSSLDHRLHYTSCNFILLMFDSIRNISSEARCSSWSVWSSLSLLLCLKKCRKILDVFSPPPTPSPPALFFFPAVCVCVCVWSVSGSLKPSCGKRWHWVCTAVMDTHGFYSAKFLKWCLVQYQLCTQMKKLHV